jgi:hypothetical protein
MIPFTSPLETCIVFIAVVELFMVVVSEARGATPRASAIVARSIKPARVILRKVVGYLDATSV